MKNALKKFEKFKVNKSIESLRGMACADRCFDDYDEMSELMDPFQTSEWMGRCIDYYCNIR